MVLTIELPVLLHGSIELYVIYVEHPLCSYFQVREGLDGVLVCRYVRSRQVVYLLTIHRQLTVLAQANQEVGPLQEVHSEGEIVLEFALADSKVEEIFVIVVRHLQ